MASLPIRHALRRLFSTHPPGLPAAGLLLLRGVVGAVLIAGPASDLVTASGGALLVAGLLTPFAALALAVALVVSLARSTAPDVSLLLLASGCLALALLGPGAWSLDARLFGRREIAIPRRRP